MKDILFIDTDAGLDDIVAICMCIASGIFDIRGISLVNGVTLVRDGTRNLTSILAYLGITIPLYRGAAQKMQNSSVQFPAIDRLRAKNLASLKGISLPKAQKQMYSLLQLQKEIVLQERPITILCLGPLSNITYLIKEPAIRRKISRLILMGGAVNVPGNIPPKNIAEYNFRLDPEAANTVLGSRIPILLVSLDTTRFVPASEPLFSFTNNKSQSRAGKIMQSIIKNNQGDFQNYYDPLAAGILIDPGIVGSSTQYALGVSTNRFSKGKVFIRNNVTKNVSVPIRIDKKTFYRLLKQLSQNARGGDGL